MNFLEELVAEYEEYLKEKRMLLPLYIPHWLMKVQHGLR